MTPPGKKRSAGKAGIELRSAAFEADTFTARPTRRWIKQRRVTEIVIKKAISFVYNNNNNNNNNNDDDDTTITTTTTSDYDFISIAPFHVQHAELR